MLLKRIAQTGLGQGAQSWQDLSVEPRTAGPEQRPLRGAGRDQRDQRLLAGADACAQQNKNADAMVDFANAKFPGINNKQALFDNAVAYLRHPCSALNNGRVVPSTLFCETPPRSPELNGVVNSQLASVDPGLFGSPNTATVAFGAREYILLFVGWGRVADRFLSSFLPSWYLPFRPDSGRGNLHMQLTLRVYATHDLFIEGV